MNDKYEIFEKFFSNNITEKERKDFIDSLENDSSLNEEYNTFKNIKSFFKERNLQKDTPIYLKGKIFNELGIENNNKYTYLVALTLLFIISSLITYRYISFNSETYRIESDFISQKILNKRIGFKKNVKHNSNYYNSKTEFSNNPITLQGDNRIDLTDKNKEKDYNILEKKDLVFPDLNKELIANKISIHKSKIYDNYNHYSLNSKNNTVHEKSYTFSYIPDFKLPLVFKIRRNLDYDFSEEITQPDKINDLNGLSLSVHYAMEDNIYIGFGLTQENFNLEYNVDENETSYIYYQRPNFSTYEIYFNYSYPLIDRIYFNSGLSAGFNNVGFVPRLNLGMEYELYEKISIELNSVYSNLFYNKSGVNYYSDKLSLQLGVNYKW